MGLGRHTRQDEDRRWRVSGLVVGLVLVVAVAAAAGLITAKEMHSAAPGGGGARNGTTTTLPAPPPLRITSVSPAPGTADAAFDTSVTVDFSQPLATDSPLPTLSPAPPGTWLRTAPEALRFVPDGYFAPYTTVQLSVPGGPAGVRSRLGRDLSSTLRKRFVIEGGSELRLQQLLAEDGYLPLQFVPAAPEPLGTAPAYATSAHLRPPAAEPATSTTTTTTTPLPAIDLEPADPSAIPLQAVGGSFTWRYGSTPASLKALWVPGQPNVITRGAIMAFEAAHGLVTDGAAGPKVWSTLLQAVAARQVTTQPYDYVMVNQALPETATVWRDGQYIFTVPVNTGIPAAATAVGTYPVYARYLVTTMTGKNPDGTHYSDPGIPWVSYFNGGDALHGFIRSSYGSPQSLGCVEMTYANASSCTR